MTLMVMVTAGVLLWAGQSDHITVTVVEERGTGPNHDCCCRCCVFSALQSLDARDGDKLFTAVALVITARGK